MSVTAIPLGQARPQTPFIGQSPFYTWKRVVATRTYYNHEFPVPHIDSVESFIDYRVPPEKATALAQFDGSVVIERTAGEVSA